MVDKSFTIAGGAISQSKSVHFERISDDLSTEPIFKVGLIDEQWIPTTHVWSFSWGLLQHTEGVGVDTRPQDIQAI